VTETLHTRSRRASLGGLVIQLVATGGVLALALTTHSVATYQVAWYLLGGVPLWFVALLVFRQRELAALEALDLEELRRERQATGGGEALFGAEGAAGLGFRVAEARLQWMQRWLVPVFGLVSALYLAVMGILIWRKLAVGRVVGGVRAPGLTIGGEGWPTVVNIPIALVILAVVMLGVFLFSRYASGMGRVREWQLLRGCGSYMLGNALVTMALLVCLGVQLYAGVAAWEHVLAYVIPSLMVVLAFETLINFVLDIYRPRAPGVEPRACFDSRLLGLFAEPGGIASSIADAINYQFGFQVSQTWFYQLLQRTFVPMALVGAVALWLLTCIVIVQPYEHVIIERWGRQLNAEAPYQPGLHFKLPWPIDRTRAYNTGQLHQINVGFQLLAGEPDYTDAMTVQLWTDEKHLGQTHFDFLTCPPPRSLLDGEVPATQPVAETPTGAKDSPVNLVRMDVAVQYRIQAERLAEFTQRMVNPDQTLRDMAWEEVSSFAAGTTVDGLLGRELSEIGRILRERIDRRVRELGLAVVYVGVTNVHPEKAVAEAYRGVVTAQQQSVADVRTALVTENERLSKVAGDAQRARRLSNAVERNRQASETVNEAEQKLGRGDPAVVAHYVERLKAQAGLFEAHIAAVAQHAQALERQREIEQDFELGLGRTLEERRAAAVAVTQAARDEQAAAAALEAAVAPVRSEAATRLSPELAAALLRATEARLARDYWEEQLAQDFTLARLEGEAAVALAKALAARWTKEMTAARDVIELQNERTAYYTAPSVYKTRRLAEVLVNGLRDARKYFLAFDPGGRTVRVRFISEDQPQLQPEDIAPDRKR